MSQRTVSPKIVNDNQGTASNPDIQWGGSAVNSSGTGLYGSGSGGVSVSVLGSNVATISSSGIAIGGGNAISKILIGTVSVTISALAAAAEEDVEVTVTGVAAGDAISVTPLAAAMETGVAIIGAWFSATNKIKIRFSNVSGSSLTGSTSNFTYLIVKP